MKHGSVGVLTVLMACTACATASTPAPAERVFPSVLHGVWEAGVATCTSPGNPDSDTRIIISDEKVEGFEDWSEVLEVSSISDKPHAWKVRVRSHMQEDEVETQSIYLMPTEDVGTLVIVDESRPETYVKCI